MKLFLRQCFLSMQHNFYFCSNDFLLLGICEVLQHHSFHLSHSSNIQYYPVADPGFPRGGGANPKGGEGANLLFGHFFPKTA